MFSGISVKSWNNFSKPCKLSILSKAKAANLDLVQMNDDPKTPVCKLMDYGKHLFDQKKQKAASKKKTKKTQLKEIKFRPTTEDGDYQVKLRNLMRFLDHGDKVKITLRFRGREMAHRELGENQCYRLKKELGDLCVIESKPNMEGRQLTMILAPNKPKK